MNKRTKKAKLQNMALAVFTFLFMALCGGVGGYLLGSLNKDILRAGGMQAVPALLLSMALILLVVGVAMFLHIYIHETGHLVFGLLTGYRFQSIRFGSLMFLKTPEGLKLKKFTLAGTGGQCLMLPPEEDAEGNYPTGLYNWGGCIMNLLLSAVCFLVYLFVEPVSIPAMVLILVSLTGLGLALMNGIPLSALANDGYNAMILHKNKEARKAFRLQLLMNYEMMNGKRISELPEEWFAFTEGDAMDNTVTASTPVIRFSYLIERKQFGEAEKLGRYILKHAEALAGVHEVMVKAELLFLTLVSGEGSEASTEDAKKQFEKNKKKFLQLKALPSMQRIFYAYYTLAEPDAKKAEEAQMLFEKIAKRYPNPAEIVGERELMELVEKKLKTE